MEQLGEILTPYEKTWRDVCPGYRIMLGRTSKYDPVMGLLYFPTRYEYESVPISLMERELFPDDTWIVENFAAFVRGEFGRGEQAKEGGESIKQIKNIQYNDTDLLHIANLYLRNCESELVYSGLLEGIRHRSGPDMSAQIYNILCDPMLGNKETSKHITHDTFAHLIAPTIGKKSRLLFVVPALPFKDQNIFRTDCPASHVDMIDIAFIVRLHILSLAIYQVHPYGADWIILSDGTAYAEILGVDEKDALDYKFKLIQCRNELNLQYTVYILDLRQIAHNLVGPESGKELFQKTTKYISERLKVLCSKGLIYEQFRVLVRGMKWNRNWKDFFKENNIDVEQAWRLVRIETRDNIFDVREKQLWDEMDALAVESAREYAAFNLALKFFSFYETFFPNAIKATTHPKANQVAVPSMGEVSPWNGVCLARDLECRPTSFKGIELYKLTKDNSSLQCYRDRGSSYPIFYYHSRS